MEQEKEKEEKVRIALLGNGPMVVRGNFVLRDGDRTIELSDAQRQAGITLCRCGQSQSMPYCDGSHTKNS